METQQMPVLEFSSQSQYDRWNLSSGTYSAYHKPKREGIPYEHSRLAFSYSFQEPSEDCKKEDLEYIL